MDYNLVIDTGVKRLTINGDKDNVLEFNPSDTIFVEKFSLLVKEFDVQINKYSDEADRLEENPDGIEEVELFDLKVQLLKESCHYLRSQIDTVFGEGTSQKVFGDSLSLDALAQFFEGISIFVGNERKQKMAKYAKPTGTPPKKKVLK